MSSVIEFEGLRKEYRRLRGGRTLAVDGLDLEVPEGGVFGFLGPNGAGKTTTIRCLLGLVAPSAGRVRLLDAEVPDRLPSVIRRVGSIVEIPALFPRFTGRRNLEILGLIDGIGTSAIAASLERVGLAERAGDLVKNYSLGMKQRLGIAAALLKDPAVLVLDEPANGLDPAGIRWLRGFMRAFAADGKTVFVSSHLLAEISEMADEVIVINKGKLVEQASVKDLVHRASTGVRVRTDQPERLRDALIKAGVEAELVSHDELIARSSRERVGTTAAQVGVPLFGLIEEERTLEDIFLELTATN
jgi:ABC-type multidrug transport system ATPase subunit